MIIKDYNPLNKKEISRGTWVAQLIKSPTLDLSSGLDLRGCEFKPCRANKKEGRKGGRERGRKEGRKGGRKEGKEGGKEEGRKKGRKEGKERKSQIYTDMNE